MTIYDQQGKIVEKKFYHSEWKTADLLKARNDGLLTDEGEAWKYRYSHMDGTGGKYDMLFRREPAAEVRLTALLRAEYERGVREAAAEAADWWSNGGPSAEVSARILALLTQEGR